MDNLTQYQKERLAELEEYAYNSSQLVKQKRSELAKLRIELEHANQDAAGAHAAAIRYHNQLVRLGVLSIDEARNRGSQMTLSQDERGFFEVGTASEDSTPVGYMTGAAMANAMDKAMKQHDETRTVRYHLNDDGQKVIHE